MNKNKKYLGWATFDVLTFGIPLYIRNLYKKPRQTLIISSIVFPIIFIVLLLLLPW
ncbi:hypothetical protein [Pontibacillus salipaludis]|uniref:Uncharacterized protein n=1 Tax=Pontibacillus salipaludis TaxID=1697394 RepID=A0ABQ1Q0U3_9BACI|nr:hypothetical protein [Pontibacillus salipaludis]GGD09760.1 hypothetical protein GCM10011389_16570 [Pontibacillus salipaludis]